MKYCKNCNVLKDKKNTYKVLVRGKTYFKTYCKKCDNTIIRKKYPDKRTPIIKKKREYCINYAGKKCMICGYSRCVNALEFHHKDPSKKDFGISSTTITNKSVELLRNEIEKCILVCANCHREIHYNIIKVDGSL